MSSCPICATPLTASVCSACGYDPSRDYKRFPTYAPIPATKTEFLHCIRCGGIQFGLRSGDEQPVCLSCGLPRPAVEMPPVALAAYAGSAIAKSNPMKTGFTATKLAIAAFIVPYVFALNPAMLFIDTTVGEVILICITSFIGIFGVSAALEGYFLHHMPWYERLVSVAGGLMLIYPGLVTDAVGMCLVAVVLVLQIISRKRYQASLV